MAVRHMGVRCATVDVFQLACWTISPQQVQLLPLRLHLWVDWWQRALQERQKRWYCLPLLVQVAKLALVIWRTQNVFHPPVSMRRRKSKLCLLDEQDEQDGRTTTCKCCINESKPNLVQQQATCHINIHPQHKKDHNEGLYNLHSLHHHVIYSCLTLLCAIAQRSSAD